MKKVIWAICAVVVLVGAGHLKAATGTTLDYPGATDTVAWAISGNNIVGYCSNGGFRYDGTTWTTLNYPGAGGTYLYGVSGNSVVGEYFPNVNDCFLYDGTNYHSLNYPGTMGTHARDIDGSNIVGWYTDISGGAHGFLYNGASYTSLNYPGAMGTIMIGISGTNMIGYYDIGGYDHGVLYDGTTWTALPFIPAGIDGSNVVGEDHLYNITTRSLTTFNLAGRYIHGISGNTIVGQYSDSSGNTHGFLYTIPEPCTLAFLCVGGLLLSRRNRRCFFSSNEKNS